MKTSNSLVVNNPIDRCSGFHKGPFIFYQVGGGGLVGFGVGGHEIKNCYLGGGGASQKYKGKRGDGEKYFSKTLKWHNVVILTKLGIEQT